MKKKVLLISCAISMVIINSVVFADNKSLQQAEDGVASYGKQYWKDELTKICCDNSDRDKPCSASTTNC